MFVKLKFILPFMFFVVNVDQPNAQTFAVIGDYGEDSGNELLVSNVVKSWNPEFIITAGDNNYDFGEASTIDDNIGKYYADYIFPYSGIYGSDTATVNRFSQPRVIMTGIRQMQV